MERPGIPGGLPPEGQRGDTDTHDQESEGPRMKGGSREGGMGVGKEEGEEVKVTLL